jgi:hypothetical protein
MVQDYVPDKHKSQAAVVFNVSQAFGAFAALCTGVLLPSTALPPAILV